MIITGIAGVLLGLLFGWMAREAKLQNDVGLMRALNEEPEPEDEPDAVWKRFAGSISIHDVERFYVDEPERICTCGTSAVCPIHGIDDPWRLGSSSVAQMDPDAQWTNVFSAKG